jgi:hypothetical protein
MAEEEERAEEPAGVDPAFLKETERLEQLAMGLQSAMPVRSLPRQEYLQATVIPLLLEGLAWIIKERPDDPVENLAMFLIKNNPMSPELHRSLDLSEFE